MSLQLLTDRALLEIRGVDTRGFLQGLVTNDLQKLTPDNALYAALLTPQGKIVCDFLVYETQNSLLLDCHRDSAADLQKRLLRYRLRAKIEMRLLDGWGVGITSVAPSERDCVWRDPRHPNLGLRTIQRCQEGVSSSGRSEFLDRRLDLGIPEGVDFGNERMFALDADLDELSAISFDKGCYVGQELTARMKHRGTARKRLVPIRTLESDLPAPETPVVALQREIGSIAATYETRGFALLRLDRLDEAAEDPLSAGGIPIRVIRPTWLFP